jgi:hypothetical protein
MIWRVLKNLKQDHFFKTATEQAELAKMLKSQVLKHMQTLW